MEVVILRNEIDKVLPLKLKNQFGKYKFENTIHKSGIFNNPEVCEIELEIINFSYLEKTVLILVLKRKNN